MALPLLSNPGCFFSRCTRTCTGRVLAPKTRPEYPWGADFVAVYCTADLHLHGLALLVSFVMAFKNPDVHRVERVKYQNTGQAVKGELSE